jgi:hypothetical protein
LGLTDREPVAAAPPELGEAVEPSPRAVSPCLWVLELGAEARRAEFRAAQGSGLLSWSSRREGARARRRIVERVLASAEGQVPMPLVIAEGAALPPVTDRIGAYTSS